MKSFIMSPNAAVWIINAVILVGFLLGYLKFGHKNTYRYIILVALILSYSMTVALSLVPAFMTKVSVDSQHIIVKTPPYSEVKFSLSDVNVSEIDLSKHRELQTATRKFGSSVFGYNVGVFRLQGGQTATLMTKHSQVIVMENSNGQLALVTPDDQQGFIAEMRSKGIKVHSFIHPGQ